MMLSLKRGLSAVAVAATLIATPALSSTVTVTTQGQNAFTASNGMNAWFQRTTYVVNGNQRSAAAGVFRLTATDQAGSARDFLAFCLEPLATLTLPKVHTVSSSLSNGVLGQLSALMSNAFGFVNNAGTAAAFQLAVWEIANETSGSLSLTSGGFRVTSASGATQSLAQNWLNQISAGNWTSGGRVTIYSAPGTQDLLTDIPAPVPLPAAGLLLLGGLAGLAGLKRRKTT